MSHAVKCGAACAEQSNVRRGRVCERGHGWLGEAEEAHASVFFVSDDLFEREKNVQATVMPYGIS